MSEIEVKIVELPSMRVVCVNGFGKGPEEQAFNKMITWAKSHDQFGKPHRLFGYNNPDPAPGSPNYGYDVWMTVDESVEADGEARIIEFPGGLYAVSRVDVRTDAGDEIPAAWQNLLKWSEQSKYQMSTHQWLEEHIGRIEEIVNKNPFTLDLHLPIRE